MRKDGITFPTMMTTTKMEDEGGKFIGIVGIARDITERKKAEKDLRESERFYRDTLNDMLTFVAVLEANGNIIFVNNTTLKVAGIELEDIKGKKFYDAFWWEYSEEAKQAIKQDLKRCASGETLVHEIEIKTADGSLMWIEFSMHAILDEKGKVKFLIPEGRDVTERKLAEQALQESEERLRDIATSMADWIWEVNENGKYTYCSGKIADILGYYPDEIIGKTPFDMMPDDEAKRIGEIFAGISRDRERIKDLENWNLSKSGELVCLLTNGVPIFDEQGNFKGYRGVDKDITERKQAEEEKKSLEAQVQHVQKLESLGVLAGGIAHDFNNILMGILGHADLAVMELPPESPARYNIERVRTAAIRASELTNQMLAYSGKGRFVVEALDVNKIIEEMVHLMEVSISKKAVLKLTFTEDIPPIEADAAQVRQVILNLITNASDAVGDRSGVITITTGVLDVDEAYLTSTFLDEGLAEGTFTFIEVSDTGVGMDAETIEKMFDPFFTTKFTGRGLGLAAVLGIVRGHGGAIKVYSQPGKGTTFKVLFPSSGLKSELGDKEAGLRDLRDWRGSGTVLVVDDEESVRTVASLVLKRFGFDVLTAEDGRKAVEIYREYADEIVAVLLDMTMPYMGGEETFTELRRIKPDVKVVLISGYNEQDAPSHFAGKGLAGFIQKPFQLEKMILKIHQALKAEEQDGE